MAGLYNKSASAILWSCVSKMHMITPVHGRISKSRSMGNRDWKCYLEAVTEENKVYFLAVPEFKESVSGKQNYDQE